MYITEQKLKEINYLVVGFENCETMTIHMNDVKFIDINNISERVMIVEKCNKNGHYRNKFFVSQGIYIQIKSNCNTLSAFLEPEKGICQRISEGSDITSINLESFMKESYGDGVRVNWRGSEYCNENQISGFDKDGCFHVYIGKDEDMLNMFYNNVQIGG